MGTNETDRGAPRVERRFMDYVEPDGTVTNRRWKFLAVGTLGTALYFGAIALILGLDSPLVALIGASFGLTGAAGCLIAFTMDYVSDRKANRG